MTQDKKPWFKLNTDFFMSGRPTSEVLQYALRLRGYSLAETRDLRNLRRPNGEGIVIPFHVARAGLWAVQREWMQTSGPLQQLAIQMTEELDRAEHGLKALEAALAI